MLAIVLSDLRFALRLMRRSPGFYAMLLAILVLGTGATTAMFSIAKCLLLAPLHYPHPEELVLVAGHRPNREWHNTSIPNYLDWRERATSFSHMAGVAHATFALTADGTKPESLPGVMVSGDFFPMMAVPPVRGRLLAPEDDKVGGPHVTVISAALWHRRFGGSSDVVGRAVRLNGVPHTVVGVAAEGFRFGGIYTNQVDVWVPFAVNEPTYARALSAPEEERGNFFLHVYGRLKAGTSLTQAQADVTAVAKRIADAHPNNGGGGFGIRLFDLHDALVDDSRTGVWTLFGAVSLVFLIVCANVANLLFARAQSRRGEMAARAALGATRGRLTMQIVTETLVVFLLGALGGALVAHGLVEKFADGLVDGGGAQTIDIRVDLVAFVFAVITSVSFGLASGLIPALSVSHTPPHAALKEAAAAAGVGHRQRFARNVLVVAQVALAFALLVGSGLALRAFQRVQSTSPGFDARDLATVRVFLPDTKTREQIVTFYDAVLARIAAEPGVTAVGADTTLPMAGSNSSGSFLIEGRAPWPPNQRPSIYRDVVSRDYFQAMRIPLLRGRTFEERDITSGHLVMVISETAAAQFFPGENPIGRRINWGDDDEDEDHPKWREIIGVVGNVRLRGLERDVVPESYVPYTQHAEPLMSIVVRSPHATELLRRLPDLVQDVDPNQPVSSRRLMEDRVADSIATRRYVTLLLTVFAAAALLLATLGLFGLVSYTTSQRTRELGLRMALGSSPARIVALVFRGGMRLILGGLALGLVLAIGAGRILASRMDGVNAFDPALYAIIPALLAAAGLLACLLPAWRAVRTPPAIALRYE